MAKTTKGASLAGETGGDESAGVQRDGDGCWGEGEVGGEYNGVGGEGDWGDGGEGGVWEGFGGGQCVFGFLGEWECEGDFGGDGEDYERDESEGCYCGLWREFEFG